MGVYSKIMQGALKIGIREPIKDGRYAALLKADKVGDVVIGDIIEIEGQEFLYRGMNKHGGPGQAHYAMMGFPTPYFGPSTPQGGNKISTWDMNIFPRWKKTGHRTPEEWKSMVEQARKELEAQPMQ